MAAVIAVIAGVRAGIWKTAAPTSIVVVWAAIQLSSVAASEPYASAAQVTENPSRSASRTSRRWSRWSSPPKTKPMLSPSRMTGEPSEPLSVARNRLGSCSSAISVTVDWR